MVNLTLLTFSLLGLTVATANYTPTAKLADGSVITGILSSSVDSFKGIPYGKAPVGDLRFAPPVRYNKSLDGFVANQYGAQCYIQGPFSLDYSNLPQETVSWAEGLPFGKIDPGLGFSEDCLSVSVFRPRGVTDQDSLPVMFWIYGGGFTLGSVNAYNPEGLIHESVSMNMPVVFVTFNYRLGAFGWLGGSEINSEGPGNFGLLDQRMAMEWVADNIGGFGGNPNDVTIFGESAGSISVAHHMVMYDGVNTYKGKPLFHGAVMQSGSIVPTKKLDSSYPQSIFDHVANAAGCGNEYDKLACLRSVSDETINGAQNSVPAIFSYHSLGLSFLPRYDGKVVSDQVYKLVIEGKYAKVPYIIGDQEDEGTLFALPLSNLTTNDDFEAYLRFLLPEMTPSNLATASKLYPDNAEDGSPFRTGIFNNIFGQYKRMSAFLGDFVFQWPRRYFLENTPEVHSWSFLSDALHGLPVLGTMHGADLGFLFYLHRDVFHPSKVYRRYWIAFANYKNPNIGSGLASWPMYCVGQQNMIIGMVSIDTEPDNYRLSASNFMNGILEEILF
jgi:carboxylesterase type B